MQFVMHSTPISGLVVAETTPHEDRRGTLARVFCASQLQPYLRGRQVVQINHSVTNRIGAVRGLHFQHPPNAEMKMVYCVKGRVWDVVVDLRAGSPSLLRWNAIELSSDVRRLVLIPEGCAHGFQVIEPGSELIYLHTAFYDTHCEGGVHPLDPLLAIDWPLEIKELSDRDDKHPLLQRNYGGLAI